MMEIFGVKIWPAQYWRIVLFVRWLWMLLRWFCRKLPGWIRYIPGLIVASPELAGILMESLQVKRRVRENVVWAVLTPAYWICMVIVIILSPRRTLRAWWKRFNNWVEEKPTQLAMLHSLETADSYEEWLETAQSLDKSFGTDKWQVVQS